MLDFYKRSWCPTWWKGLPLFAKMCLLLKKRIQTIRCSKQVKYFKGETTKPVENSTFSVYSLGGGKCSILKLFMLDLYQRSWCPRWWKSTNALCKDVFIAKNRNSRIYTAVSRCAICLLQCIFQGEPPNHWKIRHLLCVPLGCGMDLEEKCSFFMLDFYKRRWCPTWWKGQTMYLLSKIKLADYTLGCNKQMCDLRAICLLQCVFQRGNHQTIGKFDILCVPLGCGMDLEEECSFYMLGFYKRSWCPTWWKGLPLFAKMCLLLKKESRLYAAVSRSNISKGKPPNQWKIRHSLCIPWAEENVRFWSFSCWIYTKGAGAQGDEKAQMHCAKMFLSPKIEIPEYTLQ